MKSTYVIRTLAVLVGIVIPIFSGFSQDQELPEMGQPARPSYETYRLDKLFSGGEASYSGALGLSIPILVVPGRHGHDFQISLTYNSSISERQFASWVGLGWDLELGAVERSVVGRADDKKQGENGENLGWIQNTLERGEMKGRLSALNSGMSMENKDQADIYTLKMDNGGLEMLPFPDAIGKRDTVSALSFMTLGYKPWEISAQWSEGVGYIEKYVVKKEDGTQYCFGADGAPRDRVDVVSPDHVIQGVHQYTTFPYRWNLSSIGYPDGSSTTIKYSAHNNDSNKYLRKYESVFIDRSCIVEKTWNVFGEVDYGQPYTNKVSFSYSHPDTLFTDTHFAVFKVSNPTTDSTSRNIRLDTVIVYERATGKALQRAIFQYASSNNPNSSWLQDVPGSNSLWSGERLNNNQLTLTGIVIQKGERIFDEQTGYGPSLTYSLTYWNNPKIDLEDLSTWNELLHQNNPGAPPFPGYYTDTCFATAWRLRSITPPTGGTVTFAYERFNVWLDPEGKSSTTGYPWSFSDVPRSRVKSKTVYEPVGNTTKVWSYAYADSAMYDPPSHLSGALYVDSTYQDYYVVDRERFYKFFRGCQPGHRWVQVNNPDSSWIRTYYTSSYRDGSRGSCPDSLSKTRTVGVVHMKSYAGKRGLVWKQVTPTSAKENYYSFTQQGAFRDRYEYYGMLGNQANYQYVEQTSIFARLDSTKGTRDGIEGTEVLQYYPTRRESSWGNGLIQKRTQRGNKFDKTTEYFYAYGIYLGMGYGGNTMWSQLYSITQSQSPARPLSKQWITWEYASNKWLPRKEWIWNTTSSANEAPPDTGATDATLGVATYVYDSQGYGNVIQKQDANGNTTSYYYGDNSTPFSNTTAGLSKGLVTGIEQAQASPVLRTSFQYDAFRHLLKSIDENGDTTEYQYDGLGRLLRSLGPGRNRLNEFAYTFPYPNTVSPTNPNSITIQNLRSSTDSSTAKVVFDGLGNERQRLQALGTGDIISAHTVDWMGRVDTSYKAYEDTLTSPHTYDAQVLSHAQSYSPSSGSYPYDLTVREIDPGGRPIKQFYSGTGFSSSDTANNHYTKFSYGANGSGVDGYEAGTLHKAITTDENGQHSASYSDKLGNTVATVADSGGLSLTTWMEYDAAGRIVSVVSPNVYRVPVDSLASGSIELYKPQTSGEIDLRGLRFGSKTITVRLNAYGGDMKRADVRPMGLEDGITIAFHINQYKGGVLVHQSSTINLGDNVTDGNEAIQTVPYVPIPDIDVDELKLVLETVLYYADCTSGSLSLDCIARPTTSTYVYNKRGSIERRWSVDDGATSYLYDKNGNLRLIKDSCHAGTAANSVSIVSPAPYVGVPYFASDTLPRLTMPGKVTLQGTVYDIETDEQLTLSIKKNGVTVYSISTHHFQGAIGSIVLPKGRYSYEVSTIGEYGAFAYSITCNSGPEFVYHKYDQMNRLLELGEYESSSVSANFTQANANNTAFPTTSRIINSVLAYDTATSEPLASGQHNLLGRLSSAKSYRLGQLALSTYYSYDDFGRIEWVVQTGLGSGGKKIAYTYDLQGNITKKSYCDSWNSTNNYCTWYEYDQAGRLARVFSGSDSTSRIKEAEYAYLATSKPRQLKLGSSPAQTVDYTYNERDWTTQIKSPSFGELLDYTGGLLGSAAQFNGNIGSIKWKTGSLDSLGYGFSYDPANRLTAAQSYVTDGPHWVTANSYKMPFITYSANGNIDSLARFGSNGQVMDRLKYHYLANSNRLDYISDRVAAGTFASDIDSQWVANYKYDDNGNMSCDSANNVGFVIYDLNNLPVSVYMRDGSVNAYTYDANGRRAQKVVSGTSTWYVLGSTGNAEVVYSGSTTNPVYNLWGADHLGQSRRTSAVVNRYYYLKDHLGSVHATVKADNLFIQDDFSGTLSQWTPVLGSGYSIQSGELANSSSGDNVLVNSSAQVMSNGTISVDTKNVSSSYADASIVLRYQDPNNYYAVVPYYNNITIHEKLSGTYNQRAIGTISAIVVGQVNKLAVVAEGANITVYWNGQYVTSWTGATRWASGKVGFRQCASRNVHWDNFVATTGGTAQVVAYDDYYPYGMVMEGRSSNSGFSDPRYKFTSKERDVEANYDYFGARYYDARIGRWLSADPIAERFPDQSPYQYVHNNPIFFVDLFGLADTTSTANSDLPVWFRWPNDPQRMQPSGLPPASPVNTDATSIAFDTVVASESSDQSLQESPSNAEQPTPTTRFFGFGVIGASLVGPAASIGFVRQDSGPIHVFFSYGFAYGFGAALGVSGGYQRGDLTGFQEPSLNGTWTFLGVYGVTVPIAYCDIANLKFGPWTFNGISGGAGPGFFYGFATTYTVLQDFEPLPKPLRYYK